MFDQQSDGNGYEIAHASIMRFNNRTATEACHILLLSFKYLKRPLGTFHTHSYKDCLFPNQD